MQDYSFQVPIFGASQNIIMNALDVVYNDHCMACNGRLAGAVVALGAPVSGLVHRQCLQNVDYTRGWMHPYPVTYYREASLVQLSRGRSPPTQQLLADK